MGHIPNTPTPRATNIADMMTTMITANMTARMAIASALSHPTSNSIL